MQTTDKAVAVSPQTTRTKYDAVLLTIRSRKSFFEVTQAIESSMQRFHTPKLMEYVTHGNRAGVEAYVDSTSKPMAIFWDFEQGSTMRLAGIAVESKFYLVGNAVIARGLFQYTGAAGLGAPTVGILQQIPRDTAIDCTRSARRDVDKALRGCRCIGQNDEMEAVSQEHSS
jgi:hypothetical protein